jgi:hypothetical protein
MLACVCHPADTRLFSGAKRRRRPPHEPNNNTVQPNSTLHALLLKSGAAITHLPSKPNAKPARENNPQQVRNPHDENG